MPPSNFAAPEPRQERGEEPEELAKPRPSPHPAAKRLASDAHRVHANRVTKAKAEKGKTPLTPATAAAAPSVCCQTPDRPA